MKDFQRMDVRQIAGEKEKEKNFMKDISHEACRMQNQEICKTKQEEKDTSEIISR